jgi:fermentation-respiration switch protein FrsA (DUF1100 family)
MSILDQELFSSVIFYPRKVNIPKGLPENVQTLQFEVDENIVLGGMFFVYNPELPTILLFHGNGEIATDYANFYHYYITSGANLAVIDYRGYGFSNGDPRYKYLFTDTPIVYVLMKSYLEDNGYRGDLFVMGRSLGSVCASELGRLNPPGLLGIIYESGFASAYHLMKKLFLLGMQNIKEEDIYEHSNEIRIKEIEAPVLIIHGENDQLIPISEAESIYELLEKTDYKKLTRIKGAGHNDIMNFTDHYFDNLTEFIAKFS